MATITAVLFDIDGTLVDTHGAGREAFSMAIEEVFGEKDELSYIHFAGATDLDVFREVMRTRGITPTKKQENEFFRQLPLCLRKTITRNLVSPFPGVRELLAKLTSDDRVVVGLLTGNTEECAKIKLDACHLHGHFVLGAFGREHARRSELAQLAMTRTRKHLSTGQRLGKCFVIGDTPSDIAAARAIGASSIAVATGVYDKKALKAVGATHVVSHLGDRDHILTLLELNS